MKSSKASFLLCRKNRIYCVEKIEVLYIMGLENGDYITLF